MVGGEVGWGGRALLNFFGVEMGMHWGRRSVLVVVSELLRRVRGLATRWRGVDVGALGD